MVTEVWQWKIGVPSFQRLAPRYYCPDMKFSVRISASSKQKLNTKSSTEVELVAIDDAMGQILWTRHFLAAQGFPVHTTKIYPDSKSTILLSENGRLSSSKQTWHLNVRYIFMTDKIQKGEVKVS